MKKVISLLQYLLIIIGIIAVLIIFVPWIAGIRPFVILSGSMEPELSVGTIVYSNTKVAAEEVNVGDVIVFKMKDQDVAHRVIAVNEDKTFTTKGDANETEDFAPVKFENYVGKAEFVVPYLGYVLQAIQTPTGKFVLFTIIGLNIVYFIFAKEDEPKSNKEEKAKKSKKTKKKDNVEQIDTVEKNKNTSETDKK